MRMFRPRGAVFATVVMAAAATIVVSASHPLPSCGEVARTRADIVGSVSTVQSVPAAAPPLEVDYERSTIVAKLRKGGLLRFLGHEHGVVPSSWTADVRFDEEDLPGSSVVVEIVVGELQIDTPEARAAAGVDPDGPSAEEAEEIRAKMLSADQLDADGFPTIRFESNRLRIDDERLRIDGVISIHGESRRLEVEAELDRDGAGYVVRGAFEVKHRDFGIDPVSIGGVVKVADEIEIRFEIHASADPAGRGPVS